MRSLPILGLVLLLLLSALAASAEPLPPLPSGAWAASPWERVLKTEIPAFDSASVELAAARNEFESFQVIVSAADQPFANVRVVASPLVGPAGEIGAENVRFFREHYIEIATPSYWSAAPPGWYPDPLIPFADPTTGGDIVGARFDATPFGVEPNTNQGVWVEVYVPRSANSGQYQGTITVTGNDAILGQIAVTLTVYDFTLPDSIAMRSWFGNWGLAGLLGLDPESEEFARVQDLYIDTLLEHRCVPSDLGDIWPNRTAEGGLDDANTIGRLRNMIEEKHVNTLSAPFWYDGCLDQCMPYLHDLDGYLQEHGWGDLAIVYMKDEPNTADDYALVREQAALLHENAPGISRLCTEQTLTQDPAWGDLYGAVDTWCPLWGLYDETTARQRQELGEEMWSYTALCQVDERNPFWEIDFPPIVYRAPFWTSWHYGIKGFLYWSTIYWGVSDDVWTTPDYQSWGQHYWGEGILLYPGADAGIEGPAPSIRLKLIREAMEDFEYMTLAARRAGKSAVDPIVDGIATSFTEWDRDPAAYYAARQSLAELIESHLFLDVVSGHWAFSEIGACVDGGVVSGYPDGLYRPDQAVSRAQMAAFIARARGWVSIGDDMAAAPELFPDVPAGSWAGTAIEACVDNGVVTGYDDGTFRPDVSISRDEMAVFIARAKGWVEVGDDMAIPRPLFADVPAEFWAGSAIEACINNQVVAGYPDGFYRPREIVTRDQMAVFVAKAFGLAM
ncbi:MAG: S-layer homology domain-containing protein [Armatimonadota bacterium]